MNQRQRVGAGAGWAARVAAVSVLSTLGAGCDEGLVVGAAAPAEELGQPLVVPAAFTPPRDGVVARVGELRPHERADLCQGGLTCDADALVIVLDPAATCDGWHLAIGDHDPPRTRLVVVPSPLHTPGTYALSEPWPIAARAESALSPSDTDAARLDIVAMDDDRVVLRTSRVGSMEDGERTVLRCDIPTSLDGVARATPHDPRALEVTLVAGGAGHCSDPEGVCDAGGEVLQVTLGPEQLAGAPGRVGELGPKGCLPQSPVDEHAVLEVTAIDGAELVLTVTAMTGPAPTTRELVVPICP